ncbi:MAG: prephenate dehydratase domain-containing protein [Chloroflexota bacterium]
MIPSLYYLGPEQTYSHQAAEKARKKIPSLQNANLVPLSSSAALYDRLMQDPSCATIVPVYNLEQGIVYDFSRFLLHRNLGTIRIKPDLRLFGSQQTLEQIKTIYTKDTVIPQVSHWVQSLPTAITIEATSEISTAKAAALAAADPTGAAICGPPAAAPHHLHPLSGGLANNKKAYTEFKIVMRATEYPSSALRGVSGANTYRLDAAQMKRIERGTLSMLWRIDARQHPALHQGHMANLRALRYWLQMGNVVHVLIDCWHPEAQANGERLAAQISDFFQPQASRPPTVVHLEAPSQTFVDDQPLDSRFDLINLNGRRLNGTPIRDVEALKLAQLDRYAAEHNIDILVGGLANVLPLNTLLDHPSRFKSRMQGALLLDYTPGSDGYAKMSTHRRNHSPQNS